MFKIHLHCSLNKTRFSSHTHYLDFSACSVYHLDSVALHMLTVALGVVRTQPNAGLTVRIYLSCVSASGCVTLLVFSCIRGN